MHTQMVSANDYALGVLLTKWAADALKQLVGLHGNATRVAVVLIGLVAGFAIFTRRFGPPAYTDQWAMVCIDGLICAGGAWSVTETQTRVRRPEIGHARFLAFCALVLIVGLALAGLRWALSR